MTTTTPRMIAFGELLMRLDATDHQRLTQTGSFNLAFSGGEVNVAVALAQWEFDSAIVSIVPDHEIGTACLNFLRRYNVDTKPVLRGADRLGLLFVETGAGQRATKVIYDRLETGFRKLQPGMIHWEEVLDGASWFHFTGTAVVSTSTRAVLLEGLQAARARNIPVSFDVSYRSSLWSFQKAKEVFHTLIPSVDLIIGSEQDAKNFFEVTSTGDECLRDLHRQYDFHWTAFTNRIIDESGRDHYSASLFDGTEISHSSQYLTTNIDRIGTGDAFAAGLIYGLLQGHAHRETLAFATAAAVLKHTVPGDFALLSKEEIHELMSEQSTGRIKR